MIDLSATITHFGQDYTVRRATADTIGADGFAVPGGTSNVTVRIHVEPARQTDLLKLPEGRRFDAAIVMLATAELKTADQVAGTNADIVEYEGKDWEVVHAERWIQGNYWRAIAQRSGR